MANDSQKNLFGGEDVPPLALPWEQVSDRLSAEIVFDLPLEKTFHYLVPDELRELIEPVRDPDVPAELLRVPVIESLPLVTAVARNSPDW